MISQSNSIPDYLKFVIGGSSGMITTLIVQPLDFIKTRMQLKGRDGYSTSYRNTFDATRQIIQNEGPMSVYSGLSAALLRQATYTSTRLGVYTMLYERFSKENQQPHFAIKLFIGMIAGIVGSFIGTPTEMALIRMTADGILPLDQKRNYRNVFHALSRIVKEDGFFGLWKAVLPTISRGGIVNLVQLASYSQAKQMILQKSKLKDGIYVHFLSSVFSGFNTAITSMPVDIIKTRLQNMRIVNGIPEYSSVWNVIYRLYKYEGVRSLWKGFTPYFIKVCSNTVLMFIIFEQLNMTYTTFIKERE